MNILVTGGNGYIGSQMCKFLDKNHNVVSFDKVYRNDSQNQEIGDLTNKDDITGCFEWNDFDLVVHLAALSGVEKDKEEYNNYYNNNVLGTLNLLSVMKDFNVKNILYASSCSVYGDNYYAKESTNLKNQPRSIYGLTKLFGENLVKFYSENHGFSYQIFRIFNVIGGDGESEFNSRRLIPVILNNIKNKKPINIYLQSDGKTPQIRDFVDIKFVLEVFNKYIQKQDNEILNIGSGASISVEDIVKMCFSITGKNTKINYVKNRDEDPDISICNTNKLTQIGFSYSRKINEIINERFN